MLRIKLSRVLVLFAGLLIGCAALTGCQPAADTDATGDDTAATQSTDTETVAVAVNANCPIGGEAVTEDGGRADWNGKTVGFCCPSCVDAWNELSEEDKEAKFAAFGTAGDDSSTEADGDAS